MKKAINNIRATFFGSDVYTTDKKFYQFAERANSKPLHGQKKKRNFARISNTIFAVALSFLAPITPFWCESFAL